MSRKPGTGPVQWLLVSDIDDTLTGDGAALERLADAIERAQPRPVLAVNSSRPAHSVLATLREVFPKNLVPDAMITALGTEISIRGSALKSWQDRFDGWPDGQVFDVLSTLGHKAHDPIFQTPFKVSFAVRGDEAQKAAREALAREGIACQIIASGVDDFDVIPENAGKDAATLFLAETLGFIRSQLVVAGDSGNDLTMFKVAGHRIAVGNARRELIDALEHETYIRADAHYAAGVHEGLVRLGVLPGPDQVTP